ncbi:unnamed protein product [Paramecium pentaurelia]|uniref:Uncharacterized protein n=1 Tax=Paramecium pentaurelia TaxID=43138 RepID=A0A8S1W7N7_9CILI|nr:unnamed protein product [Paramecium pentaurelia]
MLVEQEIVFKFLLLGGPSVGKSAFLIKYTDELFMEQYIPTIGVDFKAKHLEFNDKSIKLQIWDTAGQERFMTIVQSYFQGANGIFIIYDITNRESFNDIWKWLEQADKYAKPDVLKMLVGNKSDLNGQREVTVEEGQKFANSKGMFFIETSAKEGFNVEQAIKNFLLEVLSQYESKKKEEKPENQ